MSFTVKEAATLLEFERLELDDIISTSGNGFLDIEGTVNEGSGVARWPKWRADDFNNAVKVLRAQARKNGLSTDAESRLAFSASSQVERMSEGISELVVLSKVKTIHQVPTTTVEKPKDKTGAGMFLALIVAGVVIGLTA